METVETPEATETEQTTDAAGAAFGRTTEDTIPAPASGTLVYEQYPEAGAE